MKNLNLFSALKKAAAVVAVLSLCAGAAAKTPLERFIESRGKELPNTVNYADFYDTALGEGMVGIRKMLDEHEIPIVGGDSEGGYLRMHDLLRVCGKECSYHEGWGIFLSKFAVQVHRK